MNAEFQRVAELTNAKVTGDHGKGTCPCHDDKVGSLSFRVGDQQLVVLNCLAGCDFIDVRRALGIGPAPFAASTSDMLTYDYVDDAGDVLFQVVRRPPKQFSQRRPDGKGGWIYGLGDVERVPYQLPELIEAIALGKTIFVVEGERDVETLRSHGLTATTNAGGAAWQWPANFAKHFEGASVVIIPDNDTAGKAHAEQVARALGPVAKSVRVVPLPGVCLKGDVTDFLMSGGTRDTLLALAEAAPVIQDALSLSAEKCDESEQLPRAVRAIDVTDEQIAAPLVEGFLLRGELALFAGDGGSGKSSLALVLACAVAGGYRAFDRFQAIPGPALVVSEEDSGPTMLSRADAICTGHGWDRARVLSNMHFLALAGARLDSPTWVAHIAAEIERIGAVFVVLDPLYELTTAEESSNSEMRPSVRAMRSFSRLGTNACVLCIHHLKKDREASKIDRIRGATSVRDASRLVYHIDQADDGAITVTNLKASRSAKIPPFVVRPAIESAPDNRSRWAVARFDYIDALEAAHDKAAQFVLDKLAESPGLTTTDLRAAAKGTGLTPLQLGAALRVLEGTELITSTQGARNAKNWRLRSTKNATSAIIPLSLHRSDMQAGNDPAYAS